MIDLHMHSLFSDGELIPFELAQRAECSGYHAFAITDHSDISNYDFIIPRIVKACNQINKRKKVVAIPGIELTHVHPEDIAQLATECRTLGAKIIIVHGETIAEPVMAGTNNRAVTADIDILAHPGLISEADTLKAADKGVYLEISSRSGHSLTNGHVASIARKCTAKLVFNSDSHSPNNIISFKTAKLVAAGAGLNADEIEEMFKNSRRICMEKGFKVT